MFSLVFSNRFEILLEQLLDHLDQTGSVDPFKSRPILVPSSAVQRRIELALADRDGVCANIAFHYPAQWLWEQIRLFIPVPPTSSLEPERLVWRIFSLFAPSVTADWLTAHPRLRNYLSNADAYTRFELAQRLAYLFNHYLTYRPDWLQHWSDTRPFVLKELPLHLQEDATWQAALWQQLHKEASSPTLPILQGLQHMASLSTSALAALAPWSEHVPIFCLSTLPPLHLALLRQIARVSHITLYTLNPCREFWFDIVDKRRLSWLATQQRDLFHETGNQLLASWGKQKQDYIGQLFEGENDVVEEAFFEPHNAIHLLAQLQNAILNLEELPCGTTPLPDTDRSIEVHVCHAFTRELEVLHDRLLCLFSDNKDLKPADVLVVLPDLAERAPLIESVFGTAPSERTIPWRITGLGQVHHNPIAFILEQALALASSHFPVSAVFDLLQHPPIAAHFEFTAEDLDILHNWIKQTGIHWGLHTESLLSETHTAPYSLENGLHRLYLAWAAGEAANQAIFAGHIGAANPEGNTALILGRFWQYVKTLEFIQEIALKPIPANQWQQELNKILNDLVGNALAWIHERREVQTTLNRLAEALTECHHETLIPLEVIRPALSGLLSEPMPGGVPGGSITFTAMHSLRTLPYRVICILGLDYGRFPTPERSDEFDLIAAAPRTGDRQRRHDERTLFLDLILAARDVLHLSYTGRNIRDNAVQPPSILIDELLDTLATACAANPDNLDSRQQIRQRLTVTHPLQAFSPIYFFPDAHTDPRLISFRSEYADALAARQKTPSSTSPEPFFPTPLPCLEEHWRTPNLKLLSRFFHHPCRFILNERLGLTIQSGQSMLDDVEPFNPNWIAYKNLGRRLLPVLLLRIRQGQSQTDLLSDPALFKLAQAGGEYPRGPLGTLALKQELISLCTFAATLAKAQHTPLCSPHLPQLEFNLGKEIWSLSAAFTDLRPHGLIRYDYDNTHFPANYLSAWLAHLTLCCAPPDQVQPVTYHFSRDGSFHFSACPPELAHIYLHDLLLLYREGLSAPLPFFPKTAWEYIVQGNSPIKARAKWLGEVGNRPEKAEQNDPVYRLILRGTAAPLTQCFELATRIFTPMLTHLDDERMDMSAP